MSIEQQIGYWFDGIPYYTNGTNRLYTSLIPKEMSELCQYPELMEMYDPQLHSQPLDLRIRGRNIPKTDDYWKSSTGLHSSHPQTNTQIGMWSTSIPHHQIFQSFEFDIPMVVSFLLHCGRGNLGGVVDNVRLGSLKYFKCTVFSNSGNMDVSVSLNPDQTKVDYIESPSQSVSTFGGCEIRIAYPKPLGLNITPNIPPEFFSHVTFSRIVWEIPQQGNIVWSLGIDVPESNIIYIKVSGNEIIINSYKNISIENIRNELLFPIYSRLGGGGGGGVCDYPIKSCGLVRMGGNTQKKIVDLWIVCSGGTISKTSFKNTEKTGVYALYLPKDATYTYKKSYIYIQPKHYTSFLGILKELGIQSSDIEGVYINNVVVEFGMTEPHSDARVFTNNIVNDILSIEKSHSNEFKSLENIDGLSFLEFPMNTHNNPKGRKVYGIEGTSKGVIVVDLPPQSPQSVLVPYLHKQGLWNYFSLCKYTLIITAMKSILVKNENHKLFFVEFPSQSITQKYKEGVYYYIPEGVEGITYA